MGYEFIRLTSVGMIAGSLLSAFLTPADEMNTYPIILSIVGGAGYIASHIAEHTSYLRSINQNSNSSQQEPSELEEKIES